MERIVPVLGIDDYDVAVDFYVDRLGFKILFEHRHEPGFPVFMAVQHGNLLLSLSEHSKGHTGSELYIYVHDLDHWHRLCQSVSIQPECEPSQKPWGNTEMPVVDPFRNLLRFTQEGTHPGANTPNIPT